MKKKLKLFTIFFIVGIVTVNAQKMQLNVFAGIANYKGDLQYNAKSGKQFSLKQPKLAIGIGLEYDILKKLNLRFSVTAGKIHADDKKQPGQEKRNLNFTTSIFDVMLGLQYYIIDPDEHLLSPYVFAGINYFHFDPYTYTTSGEKVFLKPLSTEGEGFIDGLKNYNLSQIGLPFGGGIKISLSDNVKVGVEVSLRKTFTDYIDDVSQTYIDENLLLTNRGQQAVDFAYRGDEVNAGTYPAAGTQRGSLAAKDWYYFTGITFSYRLGNGSGRNGSLKKYKLGCPASVR